MGLKHMVKILQEIYQLTRFDVTFTARFAYVFPLQCCQIWFVVKRPTMTDQVLGCQILH